MPQRVIAEDVSADEGFSQAAAEFNSEKFDSCSWDQ
jgi:hypothetical protein